MRETASAIVLGVLLCLGLTLLGWQVGSSYLAARQLERTVTVKGLSEREVPADVAIWPIQVAVAENDLEALYQALERSSGLVVRFLEARQLADAEIGVGAPAIVDQKATGFRNASQISFRYTATQTITVRTPDVSGVRRGERELIELVRQGVVIGGNSYQSQTTYLFTGLNEIKPAMIEEATLKAREVAEKFAADSGSRIGKIRRASQGQFSIVDRDRNNPQVKKVRVVSTIEYQLVD